MEIARDFRTGRRAIDIAFTGSGYLHGLESCTIVYSVVTYVPCAAHALAQEFSDIKLVFRAEDEASCGTAGDLSSVMF